MSLKRKIRVSNASKEDKELNLESSPGGSDDNAEETRKSSRTRVKKAKQTEPENSTMNETTWPEHFQKLFKIFKAINTVLAFVSSKRQLAVSFSAIRSSVENLLKHPLEISHISEIKALLPDLVKFAYIPAHDLQKAHGTNDTTHSVDYSQAMQPTSQFEGHSILVLDLAENISGKRSGTPSQQPGFSTPSPSPAAIKKLIEARNAVFRRGVDELISATPEDDDPVALLIQASRTYVPVDPFLPSSHVTEGQTTFPKSDNGRPSMEQIVSTISKSIWYKDQIVYQRHVEAKEALISLLDPPVSQTVMNALSRSRNIETLYSHQAAAIDAVRKGKHVVVSTSTASGKSVIYQIPLMSYLEQNSGMTAILVFPTKALAQDQKASLEQLFQMSPQLNGLKVATYDGDTPQELRSEIRERASIILTNFDTIHASILPNEENWRSFLQRLELLVVDELHYYTGLFGSHVAQILRRLRRICAAIGNSRTRFISCSATLSNPAMYMSKMFSLDISDVEVISNDGAPSGSKEYLIWNPPLVDAMDPSLGRRSSLSEASNLMRFLLKEGARVILFCKIRKVCELAMKTIKTDLINEGRSDILNKVKAYRGGYTREDRRQIEHEAFSGHLLGIIATNALELGIDIGALDAVIMLGFPMTASNFKQQAGRAGRRSRDSLAVMIADPFPIDQHFVNNPTDLFENPLDDLVLDVENELVLEGHIQCAAYEIPLAKEDEKWFGPLMPGICEKRLKRDPDGWYHPHPKYLPFPSRHISIRGAQEDTYMVVEIKNYEGREAAYILEEIEVSRALFELYEGAVFIHQGESFIINEISHDEKIAKAFRADVNYTTSPRDITRIEPLQTLRSVSINDKLAQFGRINVHVKVFGFFKIKGKVILDAVELITAPWERETIGFWIDLPNHVLESLDTQEIDVAAAIHAAEHAFLNQFSLSQDVKTDCRVVKEESSDSQAGPKRYPRLIFYDAAGKTGGVVARAFDHVRTIIHRALTVVNGCGCTEGCKLCVQSVACKDANLISSKLGAIIILKALCDQDDIGLDT